jgi:hypothetical protein
MILMYLQMDRFLRNTNFLTQAKDTKEKNIGRSALLSSIKAIRTPRMIIIKNTKNS